MWKLDNPIPGSIRDVGQLDTFWRKYFRKDKWIIPYYGKREWTSHNYLKLLHDLTTLSPSYKAAEEGKNDYAFSNRVHIVRKPIPGFIDDEENLIERPEKLKFIEWLKGLGISLVEFPKITRIIQKHLTQCGNAWLRITAAVEGGTVRFSFNVEHYKYVAYLATEGNEDKEVVIVTEWDDVSWDEYPPELITVSKIGKPFVWKETRKDVFETVVHFKTEGNDESDWYGRPNINSAIYAMYAEIALNDLSAKVNGSELVTRAVLAFEAEVTNELGEDTEDDEDDSFTQTVKTLKRLTTNKGSRDEVSGLAAIEYPNGTKEPKAMLLDVNRDSEWYERNHEQLSSNIYEAVGWYKELTGKIQAKSGIGSNRLINLFFIANEGKIRPIQQDRENDIGWILTEMAEFTGDEEMKQYSIEFQDKIRLLVDSWTDANRTRTTVNVDSNQPQ